MSADASFVALAALACIAVTWCFVQSLPIWPGTTRLSRRCRQRRLQRLGIAPSEAGPGKGLRKPEWVNRQLVLLKAHMPDAGCRRIADTFNHLYARRGAWVSKSLVHRALTRHAHEVAQIRHALRSARPRAEAANACWGLDLTGRADATGRVHTVLGLIDHGSRVVLCLVRLQRKCGWTLLGHLCLAIARWGKPMAVRTDNRLCFTGRVFASGLRVLGIGQQRTQLHSPWQNGRIERLFGTLKWTLKPVVLIDGLMLDRFLADFVRWYNVLRPHQALGGATPMQAREGVDPWHAPQPPRQVRFVEGWAGRMVGFVRISADRDHRFRHRDRSFRRS